MSIPFVDLKAQLRSIEGEVRSAIDTILETTRFVGGPPVEDFENAFAEYVGAHGRFGELGQHRGGRRRVCGVLHGSSISSGPRGAQSGIFQKNEFHSRLSYTV